ncbi:MAG: LacI family DNA-binding transcriptional regulator [Candidatus Enteromonas sp.]
MVSILDVAAKAGVSKSSVSRYFNGGSISASAKSKIKAAVEELHYRPNAIGNMLRTNGTQNLALCVPTLVHPFFSALASEINEAVSKEGYRLIIGESEGREDGEKTFVKMVENNEVEGLILVAHHSMKDLDTSIPVVAIDRHFEGATCVTSTNYLSTQKALEYLYSQGARHIAFLGGRPAVESEVALRHQSYLDFAKEKGLEEISCYEDIPHGGEFALVSAFLPQHPEVDAIFASSDAFALAAYLSGKKCPIIGFDGALGAFVPIPKFTSVRQDIPGLGRTAVACLMQRIRGESFEPFVYVPTTFVAGETA